MKVFNQQQLTLSIEPGEVRAMVHEGRKVLYWEPLSLPPEAMEKGQIVQPEALAQALTTFIERTGAPRKSVVVSINEQGALVRILRLPAVPDRMLEETVRRTARRELPLPPEALYLAWQPLDGASGSQIDVFVVGTPRDAIDQAVAGLQEAKATVTAMDLKPLALVRAANQADVLLVNVEDESESVTLVRDFVPRIVRSVAASNREARLIAQRAEHLTTEIQRTLDFYNSTQASRHAPWSPTVCLTGALASREEIRARVETNWPLVEPAPPLTLPDEFPTLSFLPNVGLALKETE